MFSSSLQAEAVEQQLVVKSNQLNTVLQVHKQNHVPAAWEQLKVDEDQGVSATHHKHHQHNTSEIIYSQDLVIRML